MSLQPPGIRDPRIIEPAMKRLERHKQEMEESVRALTAWIESASSFLTVLDSVMPQTGNGAFNPEALRQYIERLQRSKPL